jgi:hypothetical protein
MSHLRKTIFTFRGRKLQKGTKSRRPNSLPLSRSSTEEIKRGRIKRPVMGITQGEDITWIVRAVLVLRRDVRRLRFIQIVSTNLTNLHE